MTQDSRTVIFWGAGATATLGMRTTGQQGQFIRALVPREKDSSPLSQRVGEALHNVAGPWIPALVDLLVILGDGYEERHVATVTEQQMDAMRRNWRLGAEDEQIRSRILELRALYDWTALKAVVKVCPIEEGSDRADVDFLTDLFNILDLQGQSGHGFRVRENVFLTPQRVTGAQNALKLLILAMFYIDWQGLRHDDKKRQQLEHHYDFAEVLGRRMQRQGLERAGASPDSREFYMGDVSFASLNYDPIALWAQYVANGNLNRSPSVPHVGIPARRLQIFHDLGHFVASTRVNERNSGTPWHPMNESAAQRLNDPCHGANDRIRISKFLFPHGCLTWRECPSCGKLSSYTGNQWKADSPVLIPPPPLKGFVQDVLFPPYAERERKEWDKGAVDARACVHCQTLTYAHHTQIVMQSNFKNPPPPFIEEIQRDLRVVVQDASHVVLMGYSLPRDDVSYRAFFAAHRGRDPERSVRCSVVVGTGGPQRWLGPSDLSDPRAAGIVGDGERTLKAIQSLFKVENVRFYGGGIPGVFLDGGRVRDSAVERLLNWSAATG